MVVTLVLAVGGTPLWKESAVPAWYAPERSGGTASRSVVETWWVNCGVRVLDLEGFFVCGRCRKCARHPSTRVRIAFGQVGIATERMAA